MLFEVERTQLQLQLYLCDKNEAAQGHSCNQRYKISFKMYSQPIQAFEIVWLENVQLKNVQLENVQLENV